MSPQTFEFISSRVDSSVEAQRTNTLAFTSRTSRVVRSMYWMPLALPSFVNTLAATASVISVRRPVIWASFTVVKGLEK